MFGLRFNGFVVATLFALVAAGCGDDSKPAAASTGRDNTPNGLGEICTKDTDCSNGLTCRLDTADPTGYQLCTASCTAKTDCQTKFADYTMCTGVHVCVVTCTSNSDCVSGTICDSHGWCQRGGPDSGVQTCAGEVAACSTVSTQSACEAARCIWDGACTGAPTACSTLTTADICPSVSGCEWFTSTSSCSGTPTVCSYYKLAENCATQSGCSWSSACTGVSAIASCEAAGLTYCATTPGCKLVTQ